MTHPYNLLTGVATSGTIISNAAHIKLGSFENNDMQKQPKVEGRTHADDSTKHIRVYRECQRGDKENIDWTIEQPMELSCIKIQSSKEQQHHIANTTNTRNTDEELLNVLVLQ